jgi:hypothetical protein
LARESAENLADRRPIRTCSEAMLPLRAHDLVRASRRLLRLGVITWILLWPIAALGGVEKRVESSTTTLELEVDGAATVRHELAIHVRGAPLSSFSLRGIDSDAEPLPDATLTRISDGQAASAPEPVLVQAKDGQLDVTVRRARGLRGTRFLLRVGYRTRLRDAALRHLAAGTRSELGWLGPRFDDGVDAVTLILRTRAAQTPPELRSDDEAGPQYGIVSSTLRRSRESDELELVRAHVARDEAIRWTVQLDRGLFGGAEPPAHDRDPIASAPAIRTSQARGPRLVDMAGLAALGVAYALLVWLKARAVAAQARAREATLRAWIAWSPAWRAIIAGAALGGAGAAVAFEQPPWIGAVGLLLAMLLSAHHPPRANPSLLGPGEWRPQTLDVLAQRLAPPLPGAWLDAGRARGFCVLVAALGAIVASAARAFSSSPYAGACLLLGGAALLPIFCTGRAAELPLDMLDQSRRFLSDVARRLNAGGTLAVTPIARVAAASGEIDELRLSLAPTRPVPGLLGLELGLELRERLGGFSARPVVVVRAAEGSECQRALPRGLTWMRGRSADERASLVRPKLPTAALSVALLHELAELLLAPPQEAGAASAEPSVKKATKSAGKGLSTTKAGTRSSPAHAT